MKKKAQNWDDIPSIDGLSVEWDFKTEGNQGKRAYARLENRDLKYLFETEQIPVRVFFGKLQVTGPLSDISQGGLAVYLKKPMKMDQPVTVGFFLGDEKIVSNAQVKRVREVNNSYLTGLEFINLDVNKSKYLAGVYASKILKY